MWNIRMTVVPPWQLSSSLAQVPLIHRGPPQIFGCMSSSICTTGDRRSEFMIFLPHSPTETPCPFSRQREHHFKWGILCDVSYSQLRFCVNFYYRKINQKDIESFELEEQSIKGMPAFLRYKPRHLAAVFCFFFANCFLILCHPNTLLPTRKLYIELKSLC